MPYLRSCQSRTLLPLFSCNMWRWAMGGVTSKRQLLLLGRPIAIVEAVGGVLSSTSWYQHALTLCHNYIVQDVSVWCCADAMSTSIWRVKQNNDWFKTLMYSIVLDRIATLRFFLNVLHLNSYFKCTNWYSTNFYWFIGFICQIL